MKVIDLLNKIANGEIKEITKIIYKNEIYKKDIKDEKMNSFTSFSCHREKGTTLTSLGNLLKIDNLNDEVEIIEEDKEIEKIIINSLGNIEKKLIDGSTIVLSTNKDEILHIAYKLNDLIDEVNKLKN